jgi:hypothetical protein
VTKRLLLLLIPLTAAAVVVFVGVGESAEPGNEKAAREDAARRLDSFVPPPGAEEVGGTGTRIDDFGAERGEDPRYVAADRLWVAPEPVSRVIAWLRGAAPAGSGLYSTGGSAMSVRTSREPDAYWQFGYWWPDQKGVAEERKLEVTITRHGDGTAIRAESDADWVEPRPPSEHIPRGVSAIEIDREPLAGARFEPHRTGRVEHGSIRSRTKVASIVALVNGLEVVQPATIMCPLEAPRAVIRLRFLRRVADRPVAVTSMDWPMGPCKSLSLEIEGTPRRPLSEGWLLHRRLGHVLRTLR